MDLKTPLKKAKGLGAAGDASHHWIVQRFTAIALIPLVIWFATSVIKTVAHGVSIMVLLGSPFHAVAMVLFLVFAIYHGSLGMRVIIEDYVHCKYGKLILVLLVNFVSIVVLSAAVLATVSTHISLTKKRHKMMRVPYERFMGDRNFMDGGSVGSGEMGEMDGIDKMDKGKY